MVGQLDRGPGLFDQVFGNIDYVQISLLHVPAVVIHGDS